MTTERRLGDALPVLDPRGTLIGWRAPPRRLIIAYKPVMIESPRGQSDPGLHTGMLLRVHAIGVHGVEFHVLHEGDPDAAQ